MLGDESHCRHVGNVSIVESMTFDGSSLSGIDKLKRNSLLEVNCEWSNGNVMPGA